MSKGQCLQPHTRDAPHAPVSPHPHTRTHTAHTRHLTENVAEWRALYDSPAPHEAPLPGDWASRLDAFQRLLLLRWALEVECLAVICRFYNLASHQLCDQPHSTKSGRKATPTCADPR